MNGKSILALKIVGDIDISSIEEKKLGLDKLKYSENCDLAKEIVRKYLTLGD